MSTRSCIARRTGDESFLGVYHHWDGYPTALGSTLFDLYTNHFQRNLGEMLHFLIDQHPAGWSTINSANFKLDAGFKADDDTRRCASCGLEMWKHYSQYYAKHKAGKFIENLTAGIVMLLGHAFVEPPREEKGPECYCHGSRKEGASAIDEKADSGMEWAYVFDESTREMYVFERLYSDDAGPGRELFTGKPIADLAHRHMTGMFGYGAEGHQYWATAAIVQLDGPEPNWDAVSAQSFALARVS